MNPTTSDVSWREIDVRFKAEREYVDARLDAIHHIFLALEKVSEEASKVMNIRLEGFNEWRLQSISERENLASRDMVVALEKYFRDTTDSNKKAFDDKIGILIQTLGNDIRPLQNRATFASAALWVVGIIGGLIGAVIPVILYLLKKGG